ncbi:MAG: DUF3152 domain-containing protein [Actinomycetes bacterium]
MARLERPDEPVVLTLRGRRVLALLVAVSTTTAAIVLTVPTLGGTKAPESTIEVPVTDQPELTTTEAATGAPAEPQRADRPTAALPLVIVPGTAEPAVPPTYAPVVVNGREQPQRVEPPTAASGRLAVVPGTDAPGGPGPDLLTYRVEIEAELPFDGPEFAAAVHATLNDPRGWPTRGYAFQRVDGGDADFVVIMASPALTDRLCAPLLTRGQVSCRNGNSVILNALRWGVGIEDYGGDLAAYREYMVNHEVGHRLGRGHPNCPGAGAPAPVMMQQTYGLDGCTANAWPLEGE